MSGKGKIVKIFLRVRNFLENRGRNLKQGENASWSQGEDGRPWLYPRLDLPGFWPDTETNQEVWLLQIWFSIYRRWISWFSWSGFCGRWEVSEGLHYISQYMWVVVAACSIFHVDYTQTLSTK